MPAVSSCKIRHIVKSAESGTLCYIEFSAFNKSFSVHTAQIIYIIDYCLAGLGFKLTADIIFAEAKICT